MYFAELWGAAGGGSNAEGSQYPGGCGGYSSGYVAVTPGMAISVQVGVGGRKTCSAEARPYPHGGQPSYRPGYCAGQGGGRSAIQVWSTGATFLVAGGGGGAGGRGCQPESARGGDGGGTAGVRGWASCGTVRQNGGLGGQMDGSHGAHLQGQDRGADYGNSAGGGGDGWYGGTVAGAHTGGGGGSGYFNQTIVVEGGTSTSTVKCGANGGTGANGEIRLTQWYGTQ